MHILSRISFAVLVALAGSAAARASDNRTFAIRAADDATAPYYVLITEYSTADAGPNSTPTYGFEICSSREDGCKRLGNKPQYQLRDVVIRRYLHHSQAKGEDVLAKVFPFATYVAPGGLAYVIIERKVSASSARAGLVDIYIPFSSPHHKDLAASLSLALHTIKGENEKIAPLPKAADVAQFAANLDMALRHSVEDTLLPMLKQAERNHQPIVYDRFIN